MLFLILLLYYGLWSKYYRYNVDDKYYSFDMFGFESLIYFLLEFNNDSDFFFELLMKFNLRIFFIFIFLIFFLKMRENVLKKKK